VDVKGVFIQMEISGPPLYIKLRRALTEKVLRLLPDLRKYTGEDDMLYCKLLKALYGCVHASKFWFEKLNKILHSQGYEQSPMDPCVMRRVVSNDVWILIIYVDDILILADDEETKRLIGVFEKEFRWITHSTGSEQSYLGMIMRMENGMATFDMMYYIKKLLEGHSNLQSKATPGGKNTFVIKEGTQRLSEEKWRMFHTQVARLIYLSKRARPDIVTVTSFLCTRVQYAMEEDWKKLLKVLGYLLATKEQCMILCTGGSTQLKAYIDALFALHGDSKSHTRAVIFMGGALVFAASCKQKCVMKRPTESELVDLLDNLGFVELFKEFLTLCGEPWKASAKNLPRQYLFTSLVTRGGDVVRTKHPRVRMNLTKEAIEEKRVQVEHIRTKKMVADGFMKPLEGAEFTFFQLDIMGNNPV
jgi:hypothetical protein